MIAPKVAFKVNVVALCFCRESLVVSVGGLLLVVSTLSRVIEHLLDSAIELTLKHADGVDGVFSHILSQL